MGTWGATADHDGQEGVPHMASNQSNVPIEMIEADYPLRIERYGLVPDTGGPGRCRGGLSLVREYEHWPTTSSSACAPTSASTRRMDCSAAAPVAVGERVNPGPGERCCRRCRSSR